MDFDRLARQRAIARSHVRQTFTPHQPITEADMLAGRQAELDQLLDIIQTPGLHGLLYGYRGVGKTSLAAVFAKLQRDGFFRGPYRIIKCDSTTTFATLLEDLLRDAGSDLVASEITTERRRGGGFRLRLPAVESNAEGLTGRTEVQRRSDMLSPAAAAQALSSRTELLIVDEADALLDMEDQKRLAVFLKHLSDNSSPLKVVVVGIAETGHTLLAGHPSVERCVREVLLRPMSDSELRDIVVRGAGILRLTFEPMVVDTIVSLSNGYPHFTHLLAQKSATEAVVRGELTVGMPHLAAGLSTAASEAEARLRGAYNDAVRASTRDRQDFQTAVLDAAALSPTEEFSAASLRAAVSGIQEFALRPEAVGAYLRKLADREGLLRRVGRGVYRFSDPRMTSYIRIARALMPEPPRGGEAPEGSQV